MKKIIKHKITQLVRAILREENHLEPHIATSISDNQVYPNFCLQASNNLKVFSTFRAQKEYWEILEHVTEAQGQAYLEEIKNVLIPVRPNHS